MTTKSGQHWRPLIECPKCRQDILSIYRDGKTKLRSNILVWDKDQCFAVCPKCKTEVAVPVILDKSYNRKKAHVVID